MSRGRRRAGLVAIAALGLLAACRRGPPAYRDATLPVAERVSDLLGRMTLEEKFWQLFMVADDNPRELSRYAHGVFGLQFRTPVPGDTAALDPATAARRITERVNAAQRYFVEQTRLGIPFIAFDEALHGLTQDGATAFPQAIALAATWDTALARQVSSAIARETRSRGVRLVLSPVLNLAADVRWGRTEETYGEDPYLAGVMGLSYVSPLEAAGVVTTPKHLVANSGDGGRDSYPAHWSRRWLEEYYLPPFERALKQGHARAVMAAYNSVDGLPASANPWLLTELLRQRWGFPGVVISDAGGTGGANVLHGTSADYPASGAEALSAGLDVIFQTSPEHAALFWPAFDRHRIPASVIDAAVRRVLTLKFELGLFDHPYADPDSAARAAGDSAARLLALSAARSAITLLRNQDATLPLSSTALGSVAVLGVDAAEARLGGYSGRGNHPVTILEGIRAKLGPHTLLRYEPGPGRTDHEFELITADYLRAAEGDSAPAGLRAEYFGNISFDGEPKVVRTDSVVDFHWTLAAPDTALRRDWYSVRWTGRLLAPHGGIVRLGVEGDDGYRLFLDDTLLIDRWRKETNRLDSRTLRMERGRSYAIRLEYHETVGNGRIRLVWDPGVGGEWQRNLARAVTAAGQSDVAVVVAGLEEGEFRDRASLRLPGHQEDLIRAVAATGRPVVVVLVGGSAVTMSSWLDQVGAVLLAWYPGEAGGTAVADVLFGDANPAGRLPITFPLSEGQLPLPYYHLPTGRGDDYADLTGRPRFPFGFGLSYAEFAYRDLQFKRDTIAPGDSAVVRCLVRNTSPRAGDEVVQLYLHDDLASVAQPVQRLAGFQRIHLDAGQEREVRFILGPDQLSLLDSSGTRVVEPGTFQVMIGASAADLRLRGTLTVH